MRAAVLSSPAYAGPASAVIFPSKPITTISGRPCRRPASKSFGSWAGVIFTTPVPNVRSTIASATTGMSRSVSGRRTFFPTIPA